MNTPADTTNREQISQKRLWYGFSGAALTWALAGFLDTTLAWYCCFGGELRSGIFTPTWIRVVLGCITFGLLALTVSTGYTSYKNWRHFSDEATILDAETRGREQFMGATGAFMSLALGIGIVWFSMVVYLISICQRIR